MSENDDERVPDESEQLDQLQSDETLINRGVDDVLDEGYIPPDHWSAAEGFGNTVAEQRQGETLDQRLTQEEPDGEADDGEWNPEHESRQVGGRRAGRLIESFGKDRSDMFADDVGFAGGAAAAEEAAMHIIDEGEEEAPED